MCHYSNSKESYSCPSSSSPNAPTSAQDIFQSALQLTKDGKLDPVTAGQYVAGFYRGAVSSIIQALESVKQEVRAQASPHALVFINQHAKALADLTRKLYPDARMKSMPVRINRDAYEMGKMAGSNLNPKPGLAPGVRGLLK